jgi:hypothetical protein
MEYRTLGRTGLKVSRVGFGGAPIGLQGYLTKEDRDGEAVAAQAIAAVRAALDRGVTVFDTAPAYGNGRSERLIGEVLEGRRDEAVIGTKYFFRPGRPDGEYTELLRASLDRLRTDRVDLLQYHGGVFTDELTEQILDSPVLDWVDRMRREGLCRFAGITAEGPSGGLERLLRTGRFDTLQIAYNLIYQSTCDYQREPKGIIPLARSLGVGILTMRPTTCAFLPRLLSAEFSGIDADRLTRLAINFVLSTPEVDCVLVGMRSVEEVAANVALAEDDAARLDLRALHDRYA